MREDGAVMRENDYCVHQGAPSSQEGRLPQEWETYQLLEQLGISYVRIDHGEMRTMEDCKALDEFLQVGMWKNLFLCNSQKTRFYLLVLPAEKRLVTKDLSKQLGCARLSFAGEELLWNCLQLKPGAVSVMALRQDKDKQVQLVMDRDILDQEAFACHPCVNTSSICMSTRELMENFLPAVEHSPIFVTV